MKMTRYVTTDPTMIASLMATLSSDDGLTRRYARESLVNIGEVAAPYLVKALSDSHDRLRWEAAKALSQIGDPMAAPALVRALEDDKPGVRWLAAEALINLGGEGLFPLLETLMQHSDSIRLREGAHHVLRTLVREGLYVQVVAPVLAALEDIEPAIELPFAAHAALAMLR